MDKTSTAIMTIAKSLGLPFEWCILVKETRIHHSNGIELFSLYFWRQGTFMNKEKKLCVDLNGQKIKKIKNVFCRCVISVHLAENGFKLIYSDMFRRRI